MVYAFQVRAPTVVWSFLELRKSRCPRWRVCNHQFVMRVSNDDDKDEIKVKQKSVEEIQLIYREKTKRYKFTNL
jgi:hypothetical protein